MSTDREQIADFFSIELRELEDCVSRLDAEALSQAKQLILESEKRGGRVHVTGIGKPGHLAGYISSLLSSTGTPSYVLDGTEAVHGSSGQVLAGDVVLAISNSGETSELKKTVETLKNNGAGIIAMTRSADSWLARKADVALISGVSQEGDTLNKPPRASILAEMVALQALSILLQNEKQLSMEQYGRWHPGGSLGQACRKELHGTV